MDYGAFQTGISERRQVKLGEVGQYRMVVFRGGPIVNGRSPIVSWTLVPRLERYPALIVIMQCCVEKKGNSQIAVI